MKDSTVDIDVLVLTMLLLASQIEEESSVYCNYRWKYWNTNREPNTTGQGQTWPLAPRSNKILYPKLTHEKMKLS